MIRFCGFSRTVPSAVMARRQIDRMPGEARIDCGAVDEGEPEQREHARSRRLVHGLSRPQGVADDRGLGIEPDEPAPIRIFDRRHRLDPDL